MLIIHIHIHIHTVHTYKRSHIHAYIVHECMLIIFVHTYIQAFIQTYIHKCMHTYITWLCSVVSLSIIYWCVCVTSCFESATSCDCSWGSQRNGRPTLTPTLTLTLRLFSPRRLPRPLWCVRVCYVCMYVCMYMLCKNCM